MACCMPFKLLCRMLLRWRRNDRSGEGLQKASGGYETEPLLLDEMADPLVMFLLLSPPPSTSAKPSSKLASPPPSPSMTASPSAASTPPPSPAREQGQHQLQEGDVPDTPPSHDGPQETDTAHWVVVCVDTRGPRLTDVASFREYEDEDQEGVDCEDVDFTIDISGDLPPPFSAAARWGADGHDGACWTDEHATPLFSSNGVWSNAFYTGYSQPQWFGTDSGAPQQERFEDVFAYNGEFDTGSGAPQRERFEDVFAYNGEWYGSTDTQQEEPEAELPPFLFDDLCCDEDVNVQQHQQAGPYAHGGMSDQDNDNDMDIIIDQDANDNDMDNDNDIDNGKNYAEPESLPFEYGGAGVSAQHHEAQRECPPFLDSGLWGAASRDTQLQQHEECPELPVYPGSGVRSATDRGVWGPTVSGAQHQHKEPTPLEFFDSSVWGAVGGATQQPQAGPDVPTGVWPGAEAWGAANQQSCGEAWAPPAAAAQRAQDNMRSDDGVWGQQYPPASSAGDPWQQQQAPQYSAGQPQRDDPWTDGRTHDQQHGSGVPLFTGDGTWSTAQW